MAKIGKGVPSRVSSDCSSQARLALAGAGREGTPFPILAIHRFQALLQGLCGSAKNTGMPVSTRKTACADSSLPRSQVSDRRSWAGKVVIVAARAFLIDTAP